MYGGGGTIWWYMVSSVLRTHVWQWLYHLVVHGFKCVEDPCMAAAVPWPDASVVLDFRLSTLGFLPFASGNRASALRARD